MLAGYWELEEAIWQGLAGRGAEEHGEHEGCHFGRHGLALVISLHALAWACTDVTIGARGSSMTWLAWLGTRGDMVGKMVTWGWHGKDMVMVGWLQC